MIRKVKERLAALGITLSNEPTSTDDYLVNFAIDKTLNHIINQTNLTVVPEGLTQVAIDMAVGEFLFSKKSMGQLQLESLNFDALVKQVQDGDTNVTYAIESKDSPEAQFNAFITYLQHNEVDFVKYRVLVW